MPEYVELRKKLIKLKNVGKKQHTSHAALGSLNIWMKCQWKKKQATNTITCELQFYRTL